MALLQALRQVARQQVARHAAPQSVQQLRCFAAPANQLQLIKELRERTGAPMTDVKTALQAAGWDLGEDAENVPHREEMMRNLARDCIGRPAPWDNCLPPAAVPPVGPVGRHPTPSLSASLLLPDAAVAELRKKGLAAANKKASRHAAEGLVGLAKGDGVAAVVEVRTCSVPHSAHGSGRVNQVRIASRNGPLVAPAIHND